MSETVLISVLGFLLTLLSTCLVLLNFYYRIRRNYDSVRGAKERIAELESEMDRVNVFLKQEYPDRFRRDTYKGRTDY